MASIGVKVNAVTKVLQEPSAVDFYQANPASLLSVKLFGAVGDGVTDDTAAIQAAITAGSCYFPAPTSFYVITDEIKSPSNRIISCDPTARIKRLGSSVGAGECSFIRNVDYVSGNSNIVIIGGIWDGDGAAVSRVDVPGFIGGVGFRFKKTTNVMLKDVTILTPRSFAIQSGDSLNHIYNNVTVDVSSFLGNQDGIHINGPGENIEINNYSGNSYDDCIALNADDQGDYQMTFGDISKVRINGVNHYGGQNSIRILSATSKVEDVFVENCQGTVTGRLIEIGDGGLPGGGDVRNVIFRNYSVTSTGQSGSAVSCYVNVSGLILDGFSRLSSATTHTSGVFTQSGSFTVSDMSIINCKWFTSTGVAGSLVNAKHVGILTIANNNFIHEPTDTPLGSMVSLTGSGSTIGTLILSDNYAGNLRFPLYYTDSSIGTVSMNGEVWKGWEVGIDAVNGSITSLNITGGDFDGNGATGNFGFISFFNTCSVANGTISGCRIANTTHFVVYSGTATATAQRWTIGLVNFSSVTNKTVNRNGVAITLSVNSMSTTQDRAVLTPLTGDVINNVGAVPTGLVFYDGSAWQALIFSKGLALANVWTATQTIDGGASNARFILERTGGSADNKIWDFLANTSNQLDFRAVNDADSVAAIWLRVARSTTTISSITAFSSVFTLDNSGGTPSVNAIFTIKAGGSFSPQLVFNRAGSGSDEKLWDFLQGSNNLQLRLVNDANSAATVVFNITRTGTTLGTFTLNAQAILKGTATNDSAASTFIGEIISSLIATGSAVSLTTATAANVTSISLTAGDWDVQGHVNFNLTGATATAFVAGINTTSATVPTDGSEVYSGVVTTTLTGANGITLDRKRISLAATTTVYLVCSSTFSAGTETAFGGITARRVR